MIYKIGLRVKNEKRLWTVVYIKSKTIELAITTAVEKESKKTGLNLVCCRAEETGIELI